MSFYYPISELDVKKARENERECFATIIARSALIKTVPDRNKFMHISMGTFGWMEYMRNSFQRFAAKWAIFVLHNKSFNRSIVGA